MTRISLFLLLAACTGQQTSGTYDCLDAEQRTYDVASDLTQMDVADEETGFSPQDVTAAMLGSFTGTFTPDGGDPVAIDVSTSIDGEVSVQSFTSDPPDVGICPAEWSTTLVFAMSSEKVNDAYVIDDLWSPEIVLVDLYAADLTGSKPASDFDGTLEVSGDVALDLHFDGDGWSGTLTSDGTSGAVAFSR